MAEVYLVYLVSHLSKFTVSNPHLPVSQNVICDTKSRFHM